LSSRWFPPGGIGKSVVATNLAAMAKLSDSVTLLDFSLNPETSQ